MKRKLLPLLGIAFVVAVISTGIFYGLIAGKLHSSSPGAAAAQIVLAAQGLERGTVLEKSHVKLGPPPEGQSPKGVFTDPDQVAGLTVLQPIAPGQAVMQPSVSTRDAAGGTAQAVPVGMRAVSIKVMDSPGVLAILRPGNRVDVQAVRNRNGQNGSEPELRTILQNVEVLAVQSEQGRSGPNTTVTVLAKPAEADMLGVADAGARLRLTLRNPADKDHSSLGSLILAALFQNTPASRSGAVLRAAAPVDPPVAVPAVPAAPAAEERQVALHVRIAGASAAALEELSSRLVAPLHADGWQVAPFRPGWEIDKAMESFQAKGLLDVLAASSLRTADRREVRLDTRASRRAPASMRIRFVPSIEPGGKLRVRVQPEITCTVPEGVSTRKLETRVELSDHQSFLLTGLAAPAGTGSLASRLFPGRAGRNANAELVVLVTPELLPAARPERQAAALVTRH